MRPRATSARKLSAAQWLIRSIHQRQSTLYKVTKSIVEFQKEFFEHGVKALRRSVLKDVANDIGMHESTVSPRDRQQVRCTLSAGNLELNATSSPRAFAPRTGEGVSAESVKEKSRRSSTPRIHGARTATSTSPRHWRERASRSRGGPSRSTEIMGILPSSRRRQMS